jgi:peptide/nickel transport system substrate-binding protein
MAVDRRTLFKATAGAAAAATLGAPAVAQQARVLKFIPQANLTVLDPIWTTANVTRHHGFMVYDTLYATDRAFRPQPQMAEGHTLSDDSRTYTIKLREGLKFHDGEPVRSADCIASLTRWSKRDPFGQTWAEALDAMRAIDDRTFEVKHKAPFPLFLDAIAKGGSPTPFIMPERLARTDANAQVREVVGSGPFRFVAGEFVAGSRAVYVKNDAYVPRQDPVSSFAGGKVVNFDRIEWIVLPDPASAAAALQAGEVDWWEQPLADLLPVLRRNRNLKVERIDELGNFSILRFNHLQPPFNDVRMRQALLYAVTQRDYLTAMMGNDTSLWRECFGFWPCGTPYASDAGTEVLRSARDLDRAKALIREAGYDGRKIVLLSPTDFATIHPQGLVTQDLLQRLGLNVDFVATDWGTVVQRRASREPVDRGGWNIFHTNFDAASVLTPATHAPLRGNGTSAWFGWPTDARYEELRRQWFAAASEDEQKRITVEMQRNAFATVPYIPIGNYFLQKAYRSNLSGIEPNYAPLFWNVRRG